MAGLPRRDSDRLTSGLDLTGPTHWSPTSTLSHYTISGQRIVFMVDYREADQDHQQTVLKKKCIISEL